MASYFDGNINEFINWNNGLNELTNEAATGNLQPSGKAIRTLLQDHLQHPIYVVKDSTRYRIFSSEYSYNLWKNKEVDNWQSLQLAELPKQSEYTLTCDITNPELRYVIKGDSGQSGSTISYKWGIKQNETVISDEVRVEYEIKNTSTNKTQIVPDRLSRTQTNVTKDFYKYLDEGENEITIHLSAINYEAEASPTVTISLINFNIEADFDYTSDLISQNEFTINQVKVSLNVRPESGFMIYYQLDGKFNLSNEGDNKPISSLSAEGNYIEQGRKFKGETQIQAGIRLRDLLTISTRENPVYHTLQIYARIKQNNQFFTSNILFYTFEVRNGLDGQEIGSFNNNFINFRTSVSSSSVADIPILGLPTLVATQYEPFKLYWGYYTDNNGATDISVDWELLESNGQSTVVAPGLGAQRFEEAKEPLTFIPSIYSEANRQIYLVAKINDVAILTLPMKINKGEGVTETANYDLKLSAYGRQNTGTGVDEWSFGRYSTTFTGFKWDNINGWDAANGALRTYGPDAYAVINCAPLSDYSRGKTIEIEFESEKINNNDDVLIRIGSDYQARIDIKPNAAILYDTGGIEVVKTNFKTNERLKLQFIINESRNDERSSLIFIVNNGILERGASGKSTTFSTTGNIKIGGSNSGVKVYNIRVYNFSLTYKEAYNNWIFDDLDKIEILQRNDIYNSSGKISYDMCCGKLDTILIEGDLSKLLNGDTDKDDSEIDVTIKRTCPYNHNQDFTCTNALIRKHGQSTLHYPVPSMKFWFNKSTRQNVTPVLECKGQAACKFNKNRYRLIDGSQPGDKPSIPSNKFVLQANYADSSGVHNGSLQRLIQQTWYNAELQAAGQSETDYRLRTAPQLFASNEKIKYVNTELHEDQDPNNNVSIGVNWRGTYDNKLWKDTFVNNETGMNENPSKFPYEIQVSPYSIPCVVFYKDTSADNKETFLGSYVLMEDKKSDFLYGERSIYNFAASTDKDAVDYPTDEYDKKDPFVLKTINTKNGTNHLVVNNQNKGQDYKVNRVWNNANVLRIEVLNVNTLFTSYMQLYDMDGVGFNDPTYAVDDQGNITSTRLFRWEKDFELIYPDPDDIEEDEGMDKFSEGSKFRETVQPFIDWYTWLVGTYHNQTEFERTAAQHLDLYKLAAYYIYVLRFGLVDSLERNAQLKTYDGIHWHYEPWDMDIALGNKNTGGIAFDPPISRDTTLKTNRNEYAISGKQGDGQGGLQTSNWLWDALEAWTYWINEIVPAVAQALYKAGLSYDNVTKVFDQDYAAKWCESIYNDSGYFKYIISGQGAESWLNWLQGSRTTHRHWWLSTSMNYYDAKWNCGDFRNHKIYVATVKPRGAANMPEVIVIKPNNSTYLTVEQNGIKVGAGAIACDPENPARFDVTNLDLATKVPFDLYGASFIEELDISCLAKGLDTLTITGAYDKTLGACLKVLNVGIPQTRSAGGTITGFVNGNSNVNITWSNDSAPALDIIREINITGMMPIKDMSIIKTRNLSELTIFKAAGSGLTSFSSSENGNNFETLELPAYNRRSDDAANDDTQGFKSLTLYDCTWEQITFYDTSINAVDNLATYTKHTNNNRQALNIPFSLNALSLKGKSGSSENAQLLVLNWIDSIEGYIREHATTTMQSRLVAAGWTSDDDKEAAIEKVLREELNNRTLEIDAAEWTEDNCARLLTYKQLSLIAEFNNKNNNGENNSTKPIRGYIQLAKTSKLTAEQLTYIKQWFGENTFNKVSRRSNLVVDQPLDYVQINFGIGSDPGPITMKNSYTSATSTLRGFYTGQNDRTALNMLNNEKKVNGIFISEGKRVTVNATRFSLQETEVDAQWYFIDPETGVQSINKGSYKTVNFVNDDTNTLYINVGESSGGEDFDILLLCSLNGEASYIMIHILAVSYPESYSIELLNPGILRQYNGGYVFYATTIGLVEFYLKLNYPFEDSEGNTKPTDVIWSLKQNGAATSLLTSSYRTFLEKKGESDDITQVTSVRNDGYFRYAQNCNAEYPIKLGVSNIPRTGMLDYILSCNVSFKSGSSIDLSTHIVLMDDAYPIYTGTTTGLGKILAESYLDSTGKQVDSTIETRGFFKSDLLSITKLSARNDDVNSTLANGTKYSANDTRDDDIQYDSIFEYLPNVEEIEFVNCRNLGTFTQRTSPAGDLENYQNIVFGEMKNLKKLSFAGCGLLGYETDEQREDPNLALTDKERTIYLSNKGANTNVIKSIDLRNTYLNIELNSGTDLEEFYVGTPTSIKLENQDKLTYRYTEATSSKQLDELVLTTSSITTTGLFGIFDKIVSLQDLQNE